MTIRTAQLRHRVRIEEPNLVDNGKGGRRPPPGEAAFRTVADRVAAEVVALRGGEALSQSIQRSTQIYRVTMRKRPNITTAHRLVWGGVVLDIRSAPPSTDGASLVLTCESGVPN